MKTQEQCVVNIRKQLNVVQSFRMRVVLQGGPKGCYWERETEEIGLDLSPYSIKTVLFYMLN